MNLIKLVEILKSESELVKVITQEYPDLDIDYADVFFENEIDVNSSLMFFNAEELSGNIEFKVNGIKFINLFPLDYLLDYYNDIKCDDKTDLEIATEIINYRLHNA
jgi:hypothetical protein